MTFRSGKKPSVLFRGDKIGTVKSITYEANVEEQYPHDMLFHPSPAFKRLEKIIEKEDYNPSRRKQRNLKEILADTDLDNSIGLYYEDVSNAINKLRKEGWFPSVLI